MIENDETPIKIMSKYINPKQKGIPDPLLILPEAKDAITNTFLRVLWKQIKNKNSFFPLNNVYVEASSIMLLTDRHVRNQIQNRCPERVDPRVQTPRVGDT